MSAPLAFVGATLLDGTGRQPVADAVVLVNEGVIAAADHASRVAVPPHAARITCSGLTVMPGLIDVHTHVAEDGQPSALRRLKETTAYAAIRSAVNAGRLLTAGFTTIRDLGSFGFTDVATKRAIEQGLIEGPRMVVAGHMLVPSGTEEDGYFRPEVSTYRQRIEQGVADGPDGLRRAVRLQRYHGADLIKVVATGRIYSDAPGGPHTPTFSVDELRAACDEAHRHGMRVAAHAYGAEGIHNALVAGVDSIEHGGWIDDAAVELMLENNVFLVPTFSMLRRAAEYARPGGAPAEMADRIREIAQAHLTSFRRALEAGVRIAAGTDCGNPGVLPGDNAWELELLVEAGMSPMRAVQSATKDAAELLGLGDKTGAIVPGKWADLILVEGDPLADIGVLRNQTKLRAVMKDGKLHRNELAKAAEIEHS